MTGPWPRLAGNNEAGLETLQAHRLDANDEGEPLRLSLAFQEAQVDYCLAQKSACLGP